MSRTERRERSGRSRSDIAARPERAAASPGAEGRGRAGGPGDGDRPAGGDRLTGCHRPTGRDRPAGGAGSALLLPPFVQRDLLRGLEAAYPREGCGVLLGRLEDGVRRATRQVAAENRWDGRRDRYLIDPGTLRRLMEEEERGGPRILGFYHSHPDAPAEPSATDREHAWPWYHYLIVPVAAGRAGAGRVWELDPDTGEFVERGFRPG